LIIHIKEDIAARLLASGNFYKANREQKVDIKESEEINSIRLIPLIDKVSASITQKKRSEESKEKKSIFERLYGLSKNKPSYQSNINSNQTIKNQKITNNKNNSKEDKNMKNNMINKFKEKVGLTVSNNRNHNNNHNYNKRTDKNNNKMINNSNINNNKSKNPILEISVIEEELDTHSELSSEDSIHSNNSDTIAQSFHDENIMMIHSNMTSRKAIISPHNNNKTENNNRLLINQQIYQNSNINSTFTSFDSYDQSSTKSQINTNKTNYHKNNNLIINNKENEQNYKIKTLVISILETIKDNGMNNNKDNNNNSQLELIKQLSTITQLLSIH